MKKIILAVLFCLISSVGFADTYTCYITGTETSSPNACKNASYFWDGSDTTYSESINGGYSSCTAALTSTQTTDCTSSSLGVITKVEVGVIGGSVRNSGGLCHLDVYPRFSGGTGTVHYAFYDNDPNCSSRSLSTYWFDVTNDTNHPTWGTDWSQISGMKILVIGTSSNTSNVLMAKGLIRVTYTPCGDSSLTWSTPSDNSTVYHTGSGLSLSGTASNTCTVKAVQYNIDGGSWVTATGTTSWSATIDQSTLNALANGSHTINTRVQREDDAYTTTGTRTFILSPLPSQVSEKKKSTLVGDVVWLNDFKH